MQTSTLPLLDVRAHAIFFWSRRDVVESIEVFDAAAHPVACRHLGTAIAGVCRLANDVVDEADKNGSAMCIYTRNSP
jgi:hypothetical protein